MLKNQPNNLSITFPDSPFIYRDGELVCDEVPLASIAEHSGTPVYVYSQADLVRRAAEFVQSSARYAPNALVCFAVKANGNPALLKLFGEAGLGADVTSGGELFLARQAGIDPGKIIFSGVGKKENEIAEALAAGIRAIHVESEMELGVVAEIAGRLGYVASVGVRVNPNIDAATHPYISTGLHGHKFGVPSDRALAMLRTAADDPRLRPVGLAAHIGSQITDLDPYIEAVRFLVKIAEEMRSDGIDLAYIDVGGGLGIDYEADAPAINEWIDAIAPLVTRAGFDLVMEPGRSIVGRSGALLTRVVYTKSQGDKRFVIVDAGMTDLIRPALYQAYHPILPVRPVEGVPELVNVVGPICETSDFLARDRLLPPLSMGVLVAILHAGAYGYAMSSNYNGHLRPAEVLVDGASYRIIRRRQTYNDLLAGT